MSNAVDHPAPGYPAPCADNGPSVVGRLLAAMEALPAQPPVAMRVLWLCDDPTTNARSLSESVELDPVLTARVLRLANSAFYGVRAAVGNVPRAVTVIGFSTVRAVAATSLSGVGPAAPRGFWHHAAAVAGAAQLIAHLFGMPANDAFVAGLLHDLGIGLLDLAVPGAWDELAAAGGGAAAERAAFGIGHADAAARVLTAWRLPSTLCEAVARHTRPFTLSESALTRTVLAAEVIAHLAGMDVRGCRCAATPEDLALAGVDGERLERLVARVEQESEALGDVLVG